MTARWKLCECKKAIMDKAEFFFSVSHVLITRSVVVNDQPGQREKVSGLRSQVKPKEGRGVIWVMC